MQASHYNKMDQLVCNTENLCERFWNWRLINFPEFATTVGVHKHDAKLNDFSFEAIKRRNYEATIFLNETKQLEKLHKDLDWPISTDLELLTLQLQVFVNGNEHRAYLCPINRLEGPQFDFTRLLGCMRKETTEDYTKILTRLSNLDTQITQEIDLMREGVRSKITLHANSISAVPTQLRNLINEPFSKSPLVKHFQYCPAYFTHEEWTVIVESAKALLETRVIPALLKLADFISEEYLRHTRPNIGITTLHKGKAFYQACLRYHTSTSMSAEDIHELGHKEVQRIFERMHDVKNKMSFHGTLGELRQHLNAECYANAEDLLTDYTDICKRVWHELPRMFLTLPKEKCTIKTIPKAQQPFTSAAFYKEGNENTNGVFWVNTLNAHDRGKYRSMALALHEGMPGHHLQSDVFLRGKSNVNFRRFIEGGSYQMIPGRFPLHTAFMEGWGLYAEYLGEEMNMYSNDGELFGRLNSEMLRAARLVVDTGLHAFNWSKLQAVDYMLQYTGTSRDHASIEIDRYITWPGQACAYKIGEMKFQQLRQKATNILGEAFDVREFHDVVLSNGALPLDILEKNVQSYIIKIASMKN